MNILLTGKCQEDFKTWLFKKYGNTGSLINGHTVYDVYNFLPESLKYALIIDFFDDKSITVTVQFGGVDDTLLSMVYYGSDVIMGGGESKHRYEVLKDAIEITNEYYNERN